MKTKIAESVEEVLRYIQNENCEGDVFGTRKSTARYAIMKGEIADSSEFDDIGLGIRVLKNKKMGFGYCIPGEEEKGVRRAVESSRFSPEIEIALPIEKRIHEVKTFDQGMEDEFHSGSGARFVQAIIDGVLSLKKDIEPTGGEFVAVRETRIVGNTNDIFLEENSTFVHCEVEATISREAGSLKALEVRNSRRFDIDFYQLGVEAAEKVDSMREPSPHMPRNPPVIIAPDALAQLLGYALLPAFYGENVRSGRSPYRGKLDERIVPEKLSIIDNPYEDWGIGSGGFDDEGVVGSEVPIISGGVVKNFLYDLKESARSNTESTGNGMRRNFKTIPGTAHRNILVKGEQQCEDISLHGDGIHVDTILGVGSSNPMSGGFSVTADVAWLLQKGENRGRIDGAMISGNFPQVLNGMEFGNDNKKTYFAVGRHKVIIELPTARLENISVIKK